MGADLAQDQKHYNTAMKAAGTAAKWVFPEINFAFVV